VIMEPIITGGGILIPPDSYLPAVGAACERHGVLLIVDEVICGFGRTGSWFGHDGSGVTPDIVTMAKGITSAYIPLAATVVSEEIFAAFPAAGDDLGRLRHINTFGGHPAGCAVALENIAAPFVIPGGMPEAEFLARLVERTGCGLLLDLTNLLLSARNEGADARRRLQEYPLHAVRQVHLAGGFRDRRGVWVDSHSEPVEDESYALLADLRLGATGLVAIVIERDDKLPELAQLMLDVERARRVWEGTA